MEIQFWQYEGMKKLLQHELKEQNRIAEKITAVEEEKQNFKAEFRHSVARVQRIVAGLSDQQCADLYRFAEKEMNEKNQEEGI